MGRGNRAGIVRLVGIMQITKPSGKVFTYFRSRGNPLIRLPDLPHDHPDFLKAYAKAKAAKPNRSRAKTGTTLALITACQASDTYLGQSKGYRDILRRHFDQIGQRYGALAYSGLMARHINSDVKQSSAPDHRMKAWRFLCSFAFDANLITDNPALDAKAPKRAKTEGHAPWTTEEIAAFRKHWPSRSRQRRAMELLFWTGARISDAVLMGIGMVDKEGVLTYRQTKTGDPAHAPWTCTLPDYAKDMEADRQHALEAVSHGKGHMTFLATEQGCTRSSKALGTLMRLAARSAGVQKSAHGLRKSRAIALAESGATPHQIAAWTGHVTLKEVERYTKKADRRRAVMGTEQDQNRANPPRTNVQTVDKRVIKQ